MKLDTAAIWFAAVLLAFAPVRARASSPCTQPTTKPADCFTLTSDDAGQLAFAALLPGRVQCGPATWWTSDADDEQADNYNPACHVTCWRGRVSLRHAGDTLELSGSAPPVEWRVYTFTLTQGPEGTTAEYTIRTPVGVPDLTVKLSDRLTALLLLRHPELRAMLDEVLAGIGADAYDPGRFLRDQLAGDVRVTDEARDRVGILVGLLDSPYWQTRDRAANALRGMGVEGAKGLLSLDRRELTPAQGLGVSVALAAWPVIERREQTANVRMGN